MMANGYESAALSLTPEASTETPVLAEGKRRRRSTVRVACNACRTKKTRCDGRRPVCGWCASHPGLHCVYDTQTSEETRSTALKRENSILKRNLDRTERLLHDLTSLPEPQSLELLRRIRLDANPIPSYGYTETFIAAEHSRILPSMRNGAETNSHSHHDGATTSYADQSAPQDAQKPRYDAIDQRPISDPICVSNGQQDSTNDRAIRP